MLKGWRSSTYAGSRISCIDCPRELQDEWYTVCCLRQVSGVGAMESMQTTNSIEAPDDLPCIAKVVLLYLDLYAI
jgi:hypothetical protein